ncbi:MAG: hypothetical protein LQ346_007497 [Caloplaca aetnensis]|nr:MAG: hypothetical protein LQ346_007497 [Caloplaca aetnensis]
MSILQANRQIYEEAREIAYRNFSATIDISAWRYRHEPGKFDSGLLDRLEGFSVLPLPKSIKNWQIDLQFRAPYSSWDEAYNQRPTSYQRPSLGLEFLLAGEEVLEAAAGLARIKGLQSLKIKFPCICREAFDPTYVIPTGNVVRMIHRVLEPLKSLRLPPVTFIAALPSFEEADSLHGHSYNTQHTRCQQSACLALAAGLGEFIQDARVRKGLSPQELKWLNIKRQVAKSRCRSSLMNTYLYELWELTEWNRDIFNPLWRRSRDTKDYRQQEFDEWNKRLSEEIKHQENKLFAAGTIKKEKLINLGYRFLTRKIIG